MFDILRTLTWEFLRRVILSLALTFPWVVIGPMGIEGLFWLANLEPDGEMFRPMSWHAVYLALGFFLMATPVCEALRGIRRRLFVMPVSTKFIVAWLMAATVAVVLIQELVAHWLLSVLLSGWVKRAVFGDVTWFIGPTQVIFATAVVMLMAMFFSLEYFRFRKLVIFFGGIVAYGWWVGIHFYPEGYHGTPHAWRIFTLIDLAVFTGIAVTSWIVAVRSVARERAGDTVCESFDQQVQVIADRVIAFLFRDDRMQLRSPSEAIQWHEWRGGGRDAVLVCGTCVGGFIGIFLFLMMTGNHRFELEGAVVITIAMTSLQGLAMGLSSTLWDQKAQQQFRMKMRPFTATIPMTNAVLSAALLRGKLKITFYGWLAGLIPLLISLSAAHFSGMLKARFYHAVPIGQTGIEIPAVWALVAITPLTLVFSWIVAGGFASLLWTGSQILWSAVTFVICGGFVLFMVIKAFFLPAELVPVFQQSTAATVSTLIVLGSLVTFHVAWKKDLIQKSTPLNGAIFWALLSAVLWTVIPTEPFYRICVCASMALTVLPFAAGPLAIVRNRHAI